MNPADLVSRRAYVRVYSAALGCENQIMAEGYAVWYNDAPMLGIEYDGHQHAWSTRLRIEEVPVPVVSGCMCPDVQIGTVGDPEPKPTMKGLDPECPEHGREVRP